MTQKTIVIFIGAIFGLVLIGLVAVLILKQFSTPQKSDQICIQVITKATNPKTGQIKAFPTPCDVPAGWQVVQSEISPNGSASEHKLQFDNPARPADPFSDQQGPYFHQIVQATSSDGLHFTKIPGVVFDKASVPDIIKLASGRLLIYTVDGAGRSKSGLMVAISDDSGKTWQSGSLQLKSAQKTIGGADPEAIMLPNGKIRLHYVVFPDRPNPPNPNPNTVNQVYSALSADGIHFEAEDGLRFEYTQLTDPDIVMINNRWFMYFSQGPRLVAASSTDGLAYKLEKTIRENGSVSNTVSIDDGKWRQYYCSNGIKSATTSDGLSWNDDAGHRLQPDQNQIMCDPAPAKIGDEWVMYYKIGPAPSTKKP